jgi:hypothetical protein
MLRTWLIVGIVISLAGLGSAQTPPAKDSLAPAKDGDLDGAGRRGKQVVIEMRVIEGRGIAAAKSPGVDLWGDQLGPGMKVLAEPIVATIFGRPVSVGLQGQQSFSYLVPLGEGRFEAKDTDPLELGMRFTLVVQPGSWKLNSRRWTAGKRLQGSTWTSVNRSSPRDHSRPRAA